MRGRDLSRVKRAEIEAFQFFGLKNTLNYVYQNSDFYKELFHERGIAPEDIQCLDDLAKLPLTDPVGLAEAPYKFACISLGKMARQYVFDTSGTTGPPKKVACTQKDIDRMVAFMSAGIATVSKSGEVTLILLPDGRTNSQAELLSKGVRKMGGIPVVGDLAASPEEQIAAIERYHPQVIFTSTSRMHRITMGYQARDRLGSLGVKTLFLTSEHLSETMRKKLQDIWNCHVHAHYGMTEMGLGVSVECHARSGFHYNEADMILEVIDPDTKETIEDGQEGELVFTTLTREGTPLIRYRTHDISRVMGDPCACGAATLKKIDGMIRKKESLVTIGGGDDIHPPFFDDVIYSLSEVIDYQLTITRYGDKDCLVFKVEVTEAGKDLGTKIKKKLLDTRVIKKNMRIDTLIEPDVKMVSPGKLQRRTRAKKLIIDNRQEAN